MKPLDETSPSPVPFSGGNAASVFASPYRNGEYLAKNPGWHVEESAWKARLVLGMLQQNKIAPKTICDVGCGSGEVLKLLQEALHNGCACWGYDISPQALQLASTRANESLHFEFIGAQKPDSFFDLLLVLDVIEHVEDYFTLLRELKYRSRHKIFHFPLDLSVQTVFRRKALLKRRNRYAHLHYFTKETALETLRDTGYEVLDYFYTPRSLEFALEPGEKALKLPRRLFFAMNQDLAARVLGGFSLMVLSR